MLWHACQGSPAPKLGNPCTAGSGTSSQHLYPHLDLVSQSLEGSNAVRVPRAHVIEEEHSICLIAQESYEHSARKKQELGSSYLSLRGLKPYLLPRKSPQPSGHRLGWVTAPSGLPIETGSLCSHECKIHRARNKQKGV